MGGTEYKVWNNRHMFLNEDILKIQRGQAWCVNGSGAAPACHSQAVTLCEVCGFHPLRLCPCQGLSRPETSQQVSNQVEINTWVLPQAAIQDASLVLLCINWRWAGWAAAQKVRYILPGIGTSHREEVQGPTHASWDPQELCLVSHRRLVWAKINSMAGRVPSAGVSQASRARQYRCSGDKCGILWAQ